MVMVSVMAVMRRCFIDNQDSKQSVLPRLVLHGSFEVVGERVFGCHRNEIHVLDVSSFVRHNSVTILLVKVLEQLLELGFALLK